MRFDRSTHLLRKMASTTILFAIVTSASAESEIEKSNPKVLTIFKNAKVYIQSANGPLRLVFTSWEKRWKCYPDNSCDSWFNGNAKMVRTDGKAVKWNLVESWAQDDCGANEQDKRWFHTSIDTDTNYFGWGKKDGKANHASAFLKFTGPDGVSTAFVKSNNCP